jgi:hypothetical protein
MSEQKEYLRWANRVNYRIACAIDNAFCGMPICVEITDVMLCAWPKFDNKLEHVAKYNEQKCGNLQRLCEWLEMQGYTDVSYIPFDEEGSIGSVTVGGCV